MDIKDWTETLVRFELTPNQLYILYLLYYKDESLLDRYISKVGQFNLKDIDTLETKGYLYKIGEGNFEDDEDNPSFCFTINDFVVSGKFDEIMGTKDPVDLLEELIQAYPASLSIEGKAIPARKVTDRFATANKYHRAIEQSAELHGRIIIGLKRYYAVNKHASMGIEKFIDNKYWEVILADLDGNITRDDNYF